MLATQQKSDAQIHKEVLQELKWDPRVDETEIGVQVKDGIVALVGHIPSYAKRLAAAEAAHRVNGVLDVANELEIVIPSLIRRTDEQIAEAVRYALKWDTYIPDEQIQTTVSDGWVTLEGEVPMLWQKEDAERVIRRLRGVQSIMNKIQVTAASASPGEIKSEIEGALERQAEREARRINVAVADGKVVLSGTVRSWAERRAAEGAARFARGIYGVDDQLKVDPYAYV